MAVNVSIPKVAKDVEHKDGLDIAISDGHLFVLGDGSKKIAIYAPGSWAHADVAK